MLMAVRLAGASGSMWSQLRPTLPLRYSLDESLEKCWESMYAVNAPALIREAERVSKDAAQRHRFPGRVVRQLILSQHNTAVNSSEGYWATSRSSAARCR